MTAEASFTGTARLLIVLVAIWLVARWWMRRSAAAAAHAAQRGDREPGDVRIDRAPPRNTAAGPRGRIVDADFEEIK
ncbi:MAG: hypothetical protein ACK4L7_11605 [Flavobacteriales bacterium]